MNNFELIAAATKAIESNPEFVPAYMQRGMNLFVMNQLDEAYKDFDHIIEVLHAPEAEAYFVRGTIRHSRGDADGALADCRKAIEIDPDIMTKISGKFNLKWEPKQKA